MTDGTRQGKKFSPHPATIRASLVGSYMIIGVAAVLALAALGVFIFGQQPGAYLPASLGLLAFSLIVSAAIAYAPWRRIGDRKILINDIETGRYFIALDQSQITVKTAKENTVYPYKDFEFVGKDSLFLGNNRDWGALVLARKRPVKLQAKHRASIVRPVQKGLVDPGTYDGITAIPLVYFGQDQYEEIVTAAHAYHADARKRR